LWGGGGGGEGGGVKSDEMWVRAVTLGRSTRSLGLSPPLAPPAHLPLPYFHPLSMYLRPLSLYLLSLLVTIFSLPFPHWSCFNEQNTVYLHPPDPSQIAPMSSPSSRPLLISPSLSNLALSQSELISPLDQKLIFRHLLQFELISELVSPLNKRLRLIFIFRPGYILLRRLNPFSTRCALNSASATLSCQQCQ
jgi:hypothetical protein